MKYLGILKNEAKRKLLNGIFRKPAVQQVNEKGIGVKAPIVTPRKPYLLNKLPLSFCFDNHLKFVFSLIQIPIFQPIIPAIIEVIPIIKTYIPQLLFKELFAIINKIISVGKAGIRESAIRIIITSPMNPVLLVIHSVISAIPSLYTNPKKPAIEKTITNDINAPIKYFVRDLSVFLSVLFFPVLELISDCIS